MKSYVYRITNIKEQKYYYGSRKSKKEDLMQDLKSYRSSFKKWFKVDQINNPDNYKYKIIRVFETRDEATIFESKLHYKFDVKTHSKFYNLSNQTPNGFSTSGCVAVYDPILEENKLVSKNDSKYIDGNYISINKGKVVVHDKCGKRFQVDVNDERYLSGELVSINKGKVAVKDYDGVTYYLDKDDDKIKHMNLKPCHIGKVVVKDKEGNKFHVCYDDLDFLNGNFISINKHKILVKDKEGNKFQVDVNDERYLSGELVSINKGKVAVKDKEGNKFQVDVNDERYLSGELVSVIKGYKINKKKINIYDSNDNLVFETYGTFNEICQAYNLPFTALKNSYLRNEKIYQKIGSNMSRLEKNGYIQYVGWYAKIID